MKKFLILVLAIIIIISLFAFFILKGTKEAPYEENNTFEFSLIPNCENEIEEYSTIYTSKVYTNCVKDIYFNDDKNKRELNSLTDEKGYEEFIDLLRKATNTYILKDGGSTINTYYRSEYPGTLKIILCNTIDGNKNIYIGPKTMDDSICTSI